MSWYKLSHIKYLKYKMQNSRFCEWAECHIITQNMIKSFTLFYNFVRQKQLFSGLVDKNEFGFQNIIKLIFMHITYYWPNYMFSANMIKM